jgi:hypothetical protein
MQRRCEGASAREEKETATTRRRRKRRRRELTKIVGGGRSMGCLRAASPVGRRAGAGRERAAREETGKEEAAVEACGWVRSNGLEVGFRLVRVLYTKET